jgi:hypothetical protein
MRCEDAMTTIHAAQAGQGGAVTIACVNKATVDLGVPFDKLTAALQKLLRPALSAGLGLSGEALQHQGPEALGLAVHILR